MSMIVHKHTSGFALLMTLLIVSVVISVGLTILDVTTKQVRLASTGKDSEIAFSAANAGAECGQYWKRKEAIDMEAGNDATIGCFGVTALTVEDTPPSFTPVGGTIHRYLYQFTWPNGATIDRRCSQITTVVMVADAALPFTVSAANMRTMVAGYPNRNGKTCPAGSICTVLSARGYSRACPASIGDVFPPGTIEREVLLEF